MAGIPNLVLTSFFLLGLFAISTAFARNIEQPRYDTAYACEGKTLKIECKEGELIHLIRANYGRFSITICNDHGNTEWSVNCMSPKSLRVLHGRCSQQQNCSVLASTSTFGDPCPGTLKYLEAHYQCMPAATTTTTSRPSPPWLITSQPSVWSTAKSVTVRPPVKPAPADVPAAVSATTAAAPSTAAPAALTSAASWPVPDLQGGSATEVDTQPPPSPETNTPAIVTQASSTTVHDLMPSPSTSWLDIESVQLCQPASARNLYWNWTRVGEVSVQPCPGGATGVARWRCTAVPLAPAWAPETPDLSECRSVWLTSLEARVEEGDDSIISIANEVAQVTGSKTLYGGDMMTTAKIIKKMAQKMSVDIQTFPDPRQREAIVTELLHGVVRTGSNLLDRSQLPSWRDLSYKEQMRVATSLLMGLEENAFLLADTVVREKTVIQSVKNILLSVRVVETRNVGTEQFPSAAAVEQWSVSHDPNHDSNHDSSHDWLELPRGALVENSEGGLVRLVFVAFDRMEEILQPRVTISAVGDKIELERSKSTSRVLNSKVISASLGKGRHIQLSEPVRLSLRHIKTENVSNPACVFWDYTMSAWSDEGCRVESTNRTHTTCQCDHLTNFAVLMDVHATYLQPSHQMALQIITYIGCSISVVCLLLAIVTFQLFRGLKSDRTTIHKNLCGCLLVAEILFLAGIGQTDKPIVCGIVAGLLHFFFLCAFAWMFLEGFQLYVMLIEVFEAEKSRIRWYYTIAYGAPFIIVAVSCVIDPFSYGTERYCWLRADNFFIFSFVGPVIAVILANLVFLSMAIYMMCRHANTSATLKSKEHSRLASARAWLRGAIVLVFLLGLTWTFGLLYLNQESVIMAYIFTVLNSLQGLFIFVFHCVQNEKVRKEYRNFLSRHSWLPSCVKQSVGSNAKDRRSSLYAGSNGNPSVPNSHSTESSALAPQGPHQAAGTSYFLQREWSSRNSNSNSTSINNSTQGKCLPGGSVVPQQRGTHRVNAANGNPSEEVENISFKSYSRDSGHGGSEQEDSPRSQSTTTANGLNNLRCLNNSKDVRRQPYIPRADYYHTYNITNDLSPASRSTDPEFCRGMPHDPGQQLQLPMAHHLHRTKKSNGNLLRSASPWNHTYTEIRDGRPVLRSHHGHPDEDPVYEEIERNDVDVQVSDLSDEDGKRQSDVSRQSSRSYGDNRPLIPYSPAAERNFHACLQRLKEQQSAENASARTVAVLDGDTVVCHLEPDHRFFPQDPSFPTRTLVLPPYSEC